MELYSTTGKVALQAEGNKPHQLPRAPYHVHCNHCQKHERTYECCVFMLYLTQRCKENTIRKDNTVKEQFRFFPQDDFLSLTLATACNKAVFTGQDGNFYPCKHQSGVNIFPPTASEHASTWCNVQV